MKVDDVFVYGTDEFPCDTCEHSVARVCGLHIQSTCAEYTKATAAQREVSNAIRNDESKPPTDGILLVRMSCPRCGGGLEPRQDAFACPRCDAYCGGPDGLAPNVVPVYGTAEPDETGKQDECPKEMPKPIPPTDVCIDCGRTLCVDGDAAWCRDCDTDASKICFYRPATRFNDDELDDLAGEGDDRCYHVAEGERCRRKLGHDGFHRAHNTWSGGGLARFVVVHSAPAKPELECPQREPDETGELSAEVRRWKAAALYLADCHAANLGIATLSRTSRYERGRLVAIMERCRGLLTGDSVHPQRDLDDVLQRLQYGIDEICNRFDLPRPK